MSDSAYHVAFRARQRALGLCSYCVAPTFRGGRCEAHYAKVLEANRRSSAKARAARPPHPRRRPGRESKIAGVPPALAGWHVYTLHDPDTDAVRYVGSTCHLRRRWYTHLGAAVAIERGRKTPTPVSVWFGTCAAAGKRPPMRVVAPAADEQAALALELVTIRRYAAAGAELLNVKGYVRPPPTCGRCGEKGHRRTSCAMPMLTNVEHCAARRERLSAVGQCIWCTSQASPGRSRCEPCIEKGRASAASRYGTRAAERVSIVGPGGHVCRACGLAGHNRRTCPAARAA